MLLISLHEMGIIWIEYYYRCNSRRCRYEDLVVMDIETYNRREKMLKLREELLAVEEDRMRGSKGYSVDEVTAMMRSAIKEAAGHGTAE